MNQYVAEVEGLNIEILQSSNYRLRQAKTAKENSLKSQLTTCIFKENLNNVLVRYKTYLLFIVCLSLKFSDDMSDSLYN